MIKQTWIWWKKLNTI